MLKKWIPLWVVPTLIVFAIGTVWLRLTIVRTTYDIHELNRMIEKTRQDRELFQLKVSAMRSPQKLESLARTKFGLSQPRVDQVVRFKSRGIWEHGGL